MPTELIFFDIDDTLCRFGELPAHHLNLLQTLHNRGLALAIATGRSPCMLPAPIKALFASNVFTALVSANGQLNFARHQLVSEYPLQIPTIEQLISIVSAHDLDYQLIARDKIAWSRHLPRFDELAPRFPAFCIDATLHEKTKVYQVSVFLERDFHSPPLDNALHNIDFRLMKWQRNGADIVPQMGTKSRGIYDVCRALRVPIQNTMAFGDGLNDIEMLETVGVGIAMGDAWDALKAIADDVTGTIEEQGILHALQKHRIL